MMRSYTLSELASAAGIRHLGEDARISGVSIDSRLAQAGDLFVALPGSRVDGHAYVADAAARGAAAALVSRRQDIPLPQLEADDVLAALGRLAAHNRRGFDGRLVAITGSCGKTSVKGMLSTVLARRGPVLATEGNLNNEIGLPLTLLRLSGEYGTAVVEMGARGTGHIDYLCHLATPDVAVLLNASAAHLDGFGSLQAVATAKGEIYDRLSPQGVAVVNADSPFADAWTERATATGARLISYGLHAPASVSASSIDLAADRCRFLLHHDGVDGAVMLPLPGEHSISNALATAATAIACGLSLEDVVRGLAGVQAVAGRLQRRPGRAGMSLIDDAYNANPASVRAAIDVLSRCDGPRVLVLGAMLELGAQSADEHAAIGRYAKSQGVEQLVGVGAAVQPATDAFGAGAHWFAANDDAVAAVDAWSAGAATVLVKGSRGAAMEQVLAALQAGEVSTC
ncbi:MAG: UDP-N-acetylmuramoyl-tripeptide--D-alanyl-D-alanine ligase [Chromatocurvus sp.]